MKNESILKYYIYDGEEYTTDKSVGFDKISSPSVYEVIRVIDGVPLYMEEHLDRMKESAKLLGHTIDKEIEEIYKEIYTLIEINDYPDMNIKLQCSNLKGHKQGFLTYFIKSNYPSEEIYSKGIHTILYETERENPNAKVVNIEQRSKINEKIKNEGAFEALLVNGKGKITEGSRSNIFFVKGDKAYTAPAGEVLLGITRKKIVEVCSELNIKVIEEEIVANTIEDFDGAFMTGTSVNILPISSIGEIKYNSVKNPIIEKIGRGYREDIRSYISLSKMRS